MTERQALADFMMWCDQVRGLEKMTPAVMLKGYSPDITAHLHRLHVAKNAKAAALEELRQAQGRAGEPRVRPAKIGSRAELLAAGERLLANLTGR